MNIRSTVLCLLCLTPAVRTLATVSIIDDGGVGFSQTGSWSTQNTARVNGAWRYQSSPSGTDTATYEFSGLAGGRYVASRSTWAQGNTSNATSYQISGAGGTYVQNQQVAASSFDVANGAATDVYTRLSGFNGYIPFSVTGGTVSVVVSDQDAVNYLATDAIRLESVRNDVQKIHIVGNGDSGFSETGGTWAGFNAAGDHNGGFRYSGGAVGDMVQFKFDGIDPGNYRISGTWSAGGNRSSNVTLGYSTGPGSGSVSYSQKTGSAADDVFEGASWQDMFSNVTVTGTSLTLTLQNNASGGNELLVADAFRLEKMDAVPEPGAFALAILGLAAAVSRRGRAGRASRTEAPRAAMV
ncbi:MAG: PEP-CTERM sorting domain-containing protein [Verrucomicrobiota bacterium]